MINKLAVILLVLSSCSHLQNHEDDSLILATAYGDHLYYSDVEDQLSDLHSKLDSQKIISHCIDNWLLDKILHSEATKQIGFNDEISTLVKDYESSLYIHKLEEDYISSELNTTVDSIEIANYYDLNQEAFIPEEDIVRYFMIRIPQAYDNDTLKTLWNTEDLPVLKQFINEAEGLMVLDTDKWYNVSELEDVIPDGLFKKIKFNKTENYSFEEDDKIFYVKILEISKKSVPPPLSYYSGKIRELILRSRAQDLIKNMRNDIFKEKIKSKNIKIYSAKSN